MNNSLLITGTDTNVGKTFVTTALVYYVQKYLPDRSLGLLKLMQTGTGDRELYEKLFGNLEPADNPKQKNSIKIATPLHFQAPLAPPIAAEQEGKNIDLSVVWQCLTEFQQQQDLVFIEALGGLGSPVTYELTVADIAAEWRLPTILVVPIKLGAIAQTVANVALARSRNIDLRGIVLSCCEFSEQNNNSDDLAPVGLIESLTQVPILGILPYIDDLTKENTLTTIVSDWDWELMLSSKFS
ncbi:dethiobiotin synthase [Xenococcus sp. PCC 7305]|uniref:dethiobiotin synthase n=1 Tax=Xenococcus sp. PCC 7305 TaxID=102125 RepID=UPI0002ABF073|nr:dethiobiotin synthase [Xenococcus sp. PCC 7305]ELS04717.1 dethiobiotin synthase [Xenococcus sp. PCC 7305]